MANLFEYLNQLIEGQQDPSDHADEIWSLYGQTVSVLVLDSSGFSRTSAAQGIIHSLSILMLMRKVVQPVIDAEQPILLKFEADNVFAVFSHPEAALRAAERVHAAVRDNELMLNDQERFQVCVGIGYGRLLYSETLEGYFGEEMNLASKLGEDTAEGGEILLTRSAYAAVADSLKEGFEPRLLQTSGIEAEYFLKQT